MELNVKADTETNLATFIRAISSLAGNYSNLENCSISFDVDSYRFCDSDVFDPFVVVKITSEE